MRVAARAHPLSPFVHAVEDGGAVCGARPVRGRWLLSTRLPVTCPRCLLALTETRYAMCELAMPSSRLGRSHVREVGARGFKPREGPDTLTLCGRQPSWDTRELEPGERPGEDACPTCSARLAEASGLALVQLDQSHAVR